MQHDVFVQFVSVLVQQTNFSTKQLIEVLASRVKYPIPYVLSSTKRKKARNRRSLVVLSATNKSHKLNCKESSWNWKFMKTIQITSASHQFKTKHPFRSLNSAFSAIRDRKKCLMQIKMLNTMHKSSLNV